MQQDAMKPLTLLTAQEQGGRAIGRDVSESQCLGASLHKINLLDQKELFFFLSVMFKVHFLHQQEKAHLENANLSSRVIGIDFQMY